MSIPLIGVDRAVEAAQREQDCLKAFQALLAQYRCDCVPQPVYSQVKTSQGEFIWSTVVQLHFVAQP